MASGNHNGNPTGSKPFEFDQAAADAMCELFAMGWSLRRVIEHGNDEFPDIRFPKMNTFFKWIRDNDDFEKQYARAKQEGTDAMAEELLDISDDGKNDWMEIWDKEGKNIVGWKVNGEAVQRSKLRADTRKWLMSKMKPKKYGDKIDVTSGGKRLEQQPIIVSDIRSRNVEPEQQAE